MELIIYAKYRALVARLQGELDHHSAGLVREEIDRALERTGAVNIAFDFRHVTFMDSSGIGVLMGRYKKVTALGGRLAVFGASDTVRRIMRMSGLERFMVIADKLENCFEEVAADAQKQYENGIY